MRSGQMLVALLVLAGGCETDPPLAPYNELRIVNVRDLSTNVSAAPRVMLLGAVRRDGGVLDPGVVLSDLRRASQVVQWPSRDPIPGEWRLLPDFDYEEDGPPEGAIEFVRSRPPTDGWEAVVVEPLLLPADYGVAPLAPERVVRYSPTSRPIVTSIHAIRVPDEHSNRPEYPPIVAGNDTFAVVFSEPVGTARSIHSFVSVSTADCVRHAALDPVDEPVEFAAYHCAPFTDGQSVEVRIDGSLRAAAGASVASGYGREEGAEVVLNVTLRGDAIHRAADRLALEAAAGVARAGP